MKKLLIPLYGVTFCFSFSSVDQEIGQGQPIAINLAYSPCSDDKQLYSKGSDEVLSVKPKKKRKNGFWGVLKNTVGCLASVVLFATSFILGAIPLATTFIIVVEMAKANFFGSALIAVPVALLGIWWFIHKVSSSVLRVAETNLESGFVGQSEFSVLVSEDDNNILSAHGKELLATKLNNRNWSALFARSVARGFVCAMYFSVFCSIGGLAGLLR